jgi:hypothetical protein
MVEMQAAGQIVAGIARVWGDPLSPISRATYAIGGAAWAATRGSAWLAAWDAAWDARMAARDCLSDRTDWEANGFGKPESSKTYLAIRFDPYTFTLLG